VFAGSNCDRLGLELAAGFLTEQVAQDFSRRFASLADWLFGDAFNWLGGVSMHLKLFVLSASSVLLWIVPLAALNKTLNIHKALQGLSLSSAIACAVTAGSIAKQQADEDEIEEIKTRAIKADVVDEISTSAYVSQQQRQQEAEAILANPASDVEEARQALEAIYSAESDEPEVTSLATVSEPTPLDRSLYAEICKSREAGKTNTWIIENILKMKGRKFAEGKTKLQSLLSQFEGE
jgi:predicted lipid-binding transport protein (Tim44 family)